MAVARHSCFASATHGLRTPWASPVPSSIPFPACRALRPGRVSGAVAITHAYWCLPAGARGRPLLYECHGARSLHSRYGLSVDLSTLRHGRCLARRKTGFPSAGWALTGRESHPLDECGFVWTHAPFLSVVEPVPT